MNMPIDRKIASKGSGADIDAALATTSRLWADRISLASCSIKGPRLSSLPIALSTLKEMMPSVSRDTRDLSALV